MNADTATNPQRFPIVGIGASAGGLEAVRSLFEAMPADLGAGYVLVQHLHPEHESMMSDLVARSTALPVVQVEDEMPVLPDRLHVIPPNTALTIDEGMLRLTAPRARRGLRMPVDDFFSSLAEDQQEWAIGILLSGTGSDGTAGVGLLKIRGGMLMVQEPSDAAYDGMPRSAIATGQVDYVLPVAKMPATLAAYLEHLRGGGIGLPRDAANEPATQHIIGLIRARQGHDLSWYKPSTLRRRLLRRMALKQINSLDEYVRLLNEDDAELLALTKDLLISVTAFFRDAEAWDELAANALPELLEQRGPDEPLRAWVPGCATGEEAYSLAMLLIEALEADGRVNQVLVFATDVDRDALEVARAGRYPESLVADVDPVRLERFFVREGDHYRVKKFVRERVIIAPQDLLADPPFSNIDLVSCRNLLIYVDGDYQLRLIRLFHFALVDGGFLFLGSAENLAGQERLFTTLSSKWRIYRRRDVDLRSALAFSDAGRHPLSRGLGAGSSARRHKSGYGPWTEQVLLERFTPPAVLVDDQGEVLYYHGDVRRYLGPRTGDPSNEVLRLVDEGLRSKLRGALRDAAASGGPVVAEDAQVVGQDEVWEPVRITVTPLTEPETNRAQRLITFETVPLRAGFRPEVAARERSQVDVLAQELESTRHELTTTIQESEAVNEELKASNEEVMSMNEELQSSNQELETSKEELQSLNQELTTLNNQLEVKIQELEQTNDDVTNLLFSTNIATLFLDQGLRVRRYTPVATQLMRLIPSDIGRPITDIVRSIDDPDLIDDAQAVLAGEERPAREIRSDSGEWYLRRLHPYRTERVPISGVVVTFTEMTARKQAELALAESEAALRRIADAMPALIARVNPELRYTFNNAAYADWFGVSPESLVGTAVADLVGDETFGIVRGELQRALAGETVRFDSWLPYREAGQRYCHVIYIPDRRENGEIIGVFVLVSDLTERHRNQQAIERLNAENRARANELQALFDAAPAGIFVARDPACESIAMNDAAAHLLGLPQHANPSLSRADASALTDRVRQRGQALAADELPMQVAARTGEPVNGIEIEILLDDGAIKEVVGAAAPLFDEAGAVSGAIGILTDVSSLKAAERRYRQTLERLKTHIENSPVAALEWDDRQRILRWSPAAERLFGWTEAEAMSRSLDELGLFMDDDRAEVVSMLSRLFTRETERNRGLYQNRVKGGGERWCEWCNSALRDPDGHLVSVLSLALDVTEHQKLEADLLDQAQRLEELDRRKNEFLSMLGHELRNPLAPVRNALDRLALAEADVTAQRTALELIDRQVRHIERLVHDLLDVARINRGAIELIRAPRDLRELLQESLQAMDANIRERRHRLEAELPDAPVPVDADETRLVQVFSNLLHNAAKYTDDGGHILVRLGTDQRSAQVCIQDDGRGMEPEAVQWLFDAFSQGPRSLDRADGGLGLGLTLVKQLVELHGGSVEAHSDGLQRGSTFRVYLPLADIDASKLHERAEPEQRSSAGAPTDETRADVRHGNQCRGQRSSGGAPTDEGAAQGHRVLVVDDNTEVLDSAIMLLNAMGYEASGVSTGEAALAAIHEAPPDLVLLDIGLPEMDGIEVARRLAAMPERAALKLVAVSGYAASSLGEDAGLFDDHLLKPAGREALKSVLPSTGR
ncbi:chemotaxis protein CheB [Halochromatium glycolicum]|uniref:chemotaxis protein CheB n=1 Tax=Halochromatium glycolicum TaxID=85075 RepID=UPI00190B836F